MYVCLALSELSQNWMITLDGVKFENHVAVRFVFQTRLNLVIKYLMTGPAGNSEFCIPKTLCVPWREAEENIEVEGKQNSLFPAGPVIKYFVIPPNSKKEKNKQTNEQKQKKQRKRSFAWRRLADKFAGVTCVKFKLLFPSFVRPSELVSFVRLRRVSEFCLTARDTFSFNRKTYLGWEV